MSYYPVYLEMAGRRCLVVGGGKVAERKVAGLLAVGAQVTVISPDVTVALARWSKLGSITFEARPYRSGDLAGFDIAFVATGDPALNAAIFAEGKSRGAWVNAADDPTHCDFILPAVLRRGKLSVAVSTGGHSPALSRAVREELESHFTDDYGILTEIAAEVREELRRRHLSPAYEAWRRALNGEVRELIRCGDRARAKSFLLKELGATV